MTTARCHCGAVRLSFPRFDAGEKGRCDCSICRRKGYPAVTVATDELTVEAGETLRLYTFGTHVAKHYFCGVCGIHTHHQRRSDPRQVRVNAGCIDGFDVRQIDATWKADNYKTDPGASAPPSGEGDAS